MTRFERKVIKLAKSGFPRSRIAAKMHTDYDNVKKVLDREGIFPITHNASRNAAFNINPMWDARTTYSLKRRVSAKARDGARAALEAMGALNG